MSESRGFPLFFLPYVALKDVILSFDIFSRLNLSLCSKKSKIVAVSYRMPIVEIPDITLCEDFKDVMRVREVKPYPETEPTHTLNIIPTDNKESYGTKIQTTEFEWEHYHNPSVNLTSILSNGFSDFYHISKVRFVVLRRDVKKSDFHNVLKSARNFGCLKISKETMTTDELNLIFSKLPDIQTLSLWSDIPENYDSYETWQAKEIWWKGPPRKLEDLLRIDCEQIVCQRPKFKTSDLNSFLKKWMQSPIKKEGKYLKQEIRVNKVVTDSNLYEDLPITPWNPNQRGQYFQGHNPFLPNYSIDCSHGFDLLRSDELLATIMFNNKTFSLFVWYERFPQVISDL